MQELETWKPVVGWEGYYEVSDHGRVKGVKRGALLRERVRPAGYKEVFLSGARRALVKVHRMVLEAFVGPCPKGMECCHNDGDPANNRIGNLRWDTRAANMRDSVKHGTRPHGQQIHTAKLSASDVREIRARVRSGETRASVARVYGVDPSGVSRIAANKQWGHVQ